MLDPAALAVPGDDAHVSTADAPGTELSIDVALTDGRSVAADGTAEPNAPFRCGTTPDLVAEGGTPLYDVTTLSDGETIPDRGDVTPDDAVPWIAWGGITGNGPTDSTEDGTAGDPAAIDVLPTADEFLMTGFDPAICYLADLPPEPAEGVPAAGDTGSAADARPVFLFGPPEPIDPPDFVPATDEIDPAVRPDDTTAEPLMTEAPIPDATDSGQQGLVPAAFPGDTADAPPGIDADGVNLPLRELAGAP